MEDDVRRSMEAGFNAHLTKPIDVGRLVSAIQRVASR
jgi:CheY-like chemotaxis protein